MKLGYSNYAMKEVDIFAALPRLHSMGYQAMEICARDGWQTTAAKFSLPQRRQLAATLQDLGFPGPPLMEALSVCATGRDRVAMLQRAEATFELARDLNFGDARAVVTTTVGKPDPDWESDRALVQDGFLELADLASSFDVIIAAEPHAGSNFDTPEKAVWLMENTRHDYLKVNFDISHFIAQGIDLQRSVDLCLPYAVHTHIKDGYMADGDVHYQLPGEGQMDLGQYMAAVNRGGLTVPVYVEVSRQISERPGYDPWSVAEYCYKVLDVARRATSSA